MGEKIIGLLDNAERAGWTVVKIYNLFFTDKRIIGQLIAGSSVISARGSMADAFVLEGISGEIDNVNPEEILQSTKRNFAIDYSNVETIILRKSRFKIILNQKQHKLGKRLTFCFSYKQLDNLESTLDMVLANKVVKRETN
jgi:hypothetical protein